MCGIDHNDRRIPLLILLIQDLLPCGVSGAAGSGQLARFAAASAQRQFLPDVRCRTAAWSAKYRRFSKAGTEKATISADFDLIIV